MNPNEPLSRFPKYPLQELSLGVGFKVHCSGFGLSASWGLRVLGFNSEHEPPLDKDGGLKA